jgi:hypothetical protein
VTRCRVWNGNWIYWTLLAIVRTLEHFHKYPYRQEFHMHTYHSVLTLLMCFKNLKGQTACWIQHLQEYNFWALSRLEAQCREDCAHWQKVALAEVKQMWALETVAANGWDWATIRREQLNCPRRGTNPRRSRGWTMPRMERHYQLQSRIQGVLGSMEVTRSKGWCTGPPPEVHQWVI